MGGILVTSMMLGYRRFEKSIDDGHRRESMLYDEAFWWRIVYEAVGPPNLSFVVISTRILLHVSFIL